MTGYLSRLGLVADGLRRRRGASRRERWPRARLDQYQRNRLEALVRHARANSSFWREHLAGVGENFKLEDLPPVTKARLNVDISSTLTVDGLTREELESHLGQVCSEDVLLRGHYRVLTSGGSSGRRSLFVYGRNDWRGFLEGAFRFSKQIGLNPRLPRVRVAAVSAPDAKHMTFRGAASIDVGVFNALRLSATESLDSIVEKLNAFQPQVLFGYASMVSLLAQEALAGRLELDLKRVCTTSELRTEDMTETIVSAFGSQPYDLYATTETGLMAMDCEHHVGKHVFEDLGIIEVVDRDHRPVPEGEVGERILVTNLNNFTQPLIRVEIDDRMALTSEPCPCSRTTKRMVSLEGRDDDILEFPAAEGPLRVHPIQFRSPLGRVATLAEYQLIQEPGRLRLRAVLRRGSDPHDMERDALRQLGEALRQAGVRGVELAVERVPSLPRREGAAKLKVVRRLPRQRTHPAASQQSPGVDRQSPHTETGRLR
jgi:phenylacetate-CoA ligase